MRQKRWVNRRILSIREVWEGNKTVALVRWGMANSKENEDDGGGSTVDEW